MCDLFENENRHRSVNFKWILNVCTMSQFIATEYLPLILETSLLLGSKLRIFLHQVCVLVFFYCADARSNCKNIALCIQTVILGTDPRSRNLSATGTSWRWNTIGSCGQGQSWYLLRTTDWWKQLPGDASPTYIACGKIGKVTVERYRHV